MRWIVPALVLLHGAGTRPTAHADEIQYVPAGDVHDVAVLPAALPQVHLGEASVRAIESLARAREPILVSAAALASGPAFAARGAVPLPTLPAAVADLSRERVAALKVRRVFTVGEELARLKVLRLSVKYQDALVAWLNGVELTRRNLAPEASPAALAQKTRGGEWETIYIPASPGLLRHGENQLELEVRPSAARLAPIVDVTLWGGFEARVVRGPLVQRVGADRATVVFETDLPTVGEVRLAGGRVARASDDPVTRHVIELDGLDPDSEVRYQVAASFAEAVQVGPELSFHTAPAEGEVVRFVVYGDVRTGHDTHAEILKAIEAEAPDFVLSTGDHVVRGTDESDWQRFFAVAGRVLSRTPFYPILGNHDLGVISGSERRFEDVFVIDRPADCPPGAAWYSFDFAGVHVVALDSNRYSDDRQLAWLEEDLGAARARGARAVVVAAHHGPYSRGPHGGEPIAAERYVPLLARHGAAVYFSGHDHVYQRGEMWGLPYVVTGGGGAPLYPARCGVAGKPACRTEDGARIFAPVYHYVVVEVYRDDLRLCPKRPDGTPVEGCVRLPLPRQRLSAQ
jgi:hypothetical protein